MRQSSGNPKIPSPPVQRDGMEIERVHSAGSSDGGARPEPTPHPDIDVSDVTFDGVASDTASKLRRRLLEAAIAFDNERFSEALNLLRSIDRLAPGVAEVLELRGLAHYRLGNWNAAIKDLEWFRANTQSGEQLPILADCHRAKRHWTTVEELWYELGEVSPGSELIEEGRIVYAGALADQGKIRDGIILLETAPRAPKRPRVQHLRRWYALADLYERAGDLGKARRLFAELHTIDPDFGDAKARAASLR